MLRGGNMRFRPAIFISYFTVPDHNFLRKNVYVARFSPLSFQRLQVFSATIRHRI